MAALGARGRAKLNPLHWLAVALLLIAVAAPAAAQPLVPDEPIVVMLDQAQAPATAGSRRQRHYR